MQNPNVFINFAGSLKCLQNCVSDFMKKLFLAVLLLFVIASTYSQEKEKVILSSYIDSITQQRRDKDEELKNDDKSPIPEEFRKSFQGLNYFAPDPGYKVSATLTRFDNPFHFKMKTTTDRLPEYALYGKIEFTLLGKNLQLNVYQNIELLKRPGYERYLFIPFNDLTNDSTTYGGGRFLDAEIPDGDTMIIDFNQAYNPYCAYNHKYSCPIPPEANNLDISIEAGEKKWHE
jgi:uncharacterized protein